LQIGDIEFHYVSHVCFMFRSPGGATVITDPFWAESFEWNGHTERYLSPPDLPLERITECDAVFVSHNHGDHYDPVAVARIRRQTGARVLAPPDVIEDLLKRGEPREGLISLEEGTEWRQGELAVTALGGYDRAVDAQGRCIKFSILLQCGGTTFFYSGDCHQPPPAMRGREVDALFLWPLRDEWKVRGFAESFRFKNWVLMHGDRFAPGDFWCNLDMEEQRRAMMRIVPQANIIVPKRIGDFPA